MQIQHEQVCLIEEKCKKITNMIKEQKQKGATQRSNHPHSMHVTDDAKAKMEEELKRLEGDKQVNERKYKQQVTKLDQNLEKLSHEL